jgi:uncharacterized protein YbjT (DUF2867 family)
MRVLVCGASGFVGRHVVARLRGAGVQVVAGVSARRLPSTPGGVAVDFARDVDASTWLERLQGVDAVVNAVGVLRDSTRRPMRHVHEEVPQALFAACAAAGVRRVVHVSALGIEDGDTAYARTKRAADARLADLTAAGRLEGVVLRPSVLFGPGGESAKLFLGLARLPVLACPAIVLRSRVQPLLVTELAEAVERLLTSQPHRCGVVDLAGPRALTMTEFIASLRAQAGRRPAFVRALPGWVTALSVRAGDLLPFTPWGSETLSLMEKDNVADPRGLADLLGREATDPAQFLALS